MAIGGSSLRSWSKTQPVIALSSGEADYHALVKGAVEALGLQSLANDLGWCLDIRMWVDSAAAKSIASRKGVGRVRHLEVRQLWLQEAVRLEKVTIKKIVGTYNPSDILTKPKPKNEIERLLKDVGGQLLQRDSGSSSRTACGSNIDFVRQERPLSRARGRGGCQHDAPT